MITIRCDLIAWRHVPFGGALGDQDIVVLGQDWHTATFAMQVRPTPGDTSTPLVSLTNASAGSEGISATYDSGYLYPDGGPDASLVGTVVGATIIRPQINKATLEAIPTAADPSQPQALAYDLHITRSGLPVAQFMQGAFTLNPGVTI